MLIYLIVAISFASLVFADLSRELLTWSNITVVLDDRPILRLGSGKLESGKILGVLGSSGSGKSTFLNVISGRIGNKLKTLQNDVNILKNSEIAYVYQDDNHFSMITVEETLYLAARLRRLSQYDYINNKNISISSMVEDVMNSLQLSGISNSQVGDPRVSRGISGGESKRLSVASEMLGNPRLLIADEVTSGLDSFQSLQVMNMLKKLAEAKDIAIVVSIHQPRSLIWSLFDDILLLTPNGRVAYFGPRENILSHFKSLGYECPDHTNPAEFLIDLVSLDVHSSTTKALSLIKIENIAFLFEEANKNNNKLFVKKGVDKLKPLRSVNIFGKLKRSFQRFSLLFVRSGRQALRDRATNVVRILVSGVLAAVIGQLYGRQDSNLYPESVSDRVNIVAQAAINVGMLSMIKALQLFKREKPIIDRERLSNQYSCIEYLLAKLSSEMPMDAAVASIFGLILHEKSNLKQERYKFVSVLALLGVVSSSLGLAIGSVCPNGDTSLAVGPALMVVYVIMGTLGPQRNNSNKLPWFLQPLRYFSPFRWACEGLLSAELRNQQFVSRKGIPMLNYFKGLRSSKVVGGNKALDALGIADSTYSNSMKKLSTMFGIHCLVSLIGLMFNYPKGN